MPSNRREYMREYMKRKRAIAKERGIEKPESVKESPRVDTPVDMSTSRRSFEDIAREKGAPPVGTPERRAGIERALGPVIPPPRPADWRKRLSPQPDDACVTCHHDRQSTHPDGGACGRGCLCKRFHAAGETVVPCGDCGHDVDQGHAATPCNAWLGKGYCGCPAWILEPTPSLDTEDPF